MKAVLNKASWPKFLRVNDAIERVNFNKYLLKPWGKGEVVKVLSWEEQHSSVANPDEKFHKRYVRVMRKDESGVWCLKYTWDWEIFDTLKIANLL